MQCMDQENPVPELVRFERSEGLVVGTGGDTRAVARVGDRRILIGSNLCDRQSVQADTVKNRHSGPVCPPHPPAESGQGLCATGVSRLLCTDSEMASSRRSGTGTGCDFMHLRYWYKLVPMKAPSPPPSPPQDPQAPVVCRIVSRASALRRLREDPRSLAMIDFSAEGPRATDEDPRRLQVPLARLDPGAEVELWLSRSEVVCGRHGRIAYTRNEELLMAWTWMPEARAGELEASVAAVYAELLDLIEGQGYGYPFRTWTYLHDITGTEGTLNRYQAFCKGRYAGIGGVTRPALLPAATVIGSQVPGMLVYVLAGRAPPRQLENPRQVSAFRYPRRYGPQSPSFSRAIVKPWVSEGHPQLYISGTASIVGHESVHEADLLRQLDEILRNLQTLISSPGRDRLPGLNALADLTALKIYLRDVQDTAIVTQVLRARLGPATPLLFLHGEVCRSELLLEIEALYTP